MQGRLTDFSFTSRAKIILDPWEIFSLVVLCCAKDGYFLTPNATCAPFCPEGDLALKAFLGCWMEELFVILRIFKTLNTIVVDHNPTTLVKVKIA
jgi:hypothetical protein